MPAAGGNATQVTEDGGFVAKESPDGETLFFDRVVDGQRSLWEMPVKGGEKSLVLATLSRAFTFVVVREGIYFFQDFLSFQFFSFATGKATPVFSGLERAQMGDSYLRSVSPDGRWALLTTGGFPESDLMLVENFR